MSSWCALSKRLLIAVALATSAFAACAAAFAIVSLAEWYSPAVAAAAFVASATLAALALHAVWRERRLTLGWVATALAAALACTAALALEAGLFVAARRFPLAAGEPPGIHGMVEPGFEEIAQAFRENFGRRGECGAACAVYLRGRKVVDLWGGYRDAATRQPWASDTMVAVFSSTKGLAAMTLALAHSRGLVDYDRRVSDYWPEFASGGKQDVTVRQLLAHQAGLACLDERVPLDTLRRPDPLAGVLARQRPLWPPGSRVGYHGITIGLYEGELIRRVDPLHRTLGQVFRDEIARPLQLEFYIGLPPEVPAGRLAALEFFDLSATLLRPQDIEWRFLAALRRPDSLTARMFSNPNLGEIFPDYGRAELRGLEIPSANGVGEARAMARAYGELAMGGPALGLTARTLAELRAPAVAPSGGTADLVLRAPTHFSLGFTKPGDGFRFGASDSAFGSPGMGGSFGFADPDRLLGYAYTPNRLGYYLRDDPRDRALRRALDRCLRRLGPTAL